MNIRMEQTEEICKWHRTIGGVRTRGGCWTSASTILGGFVTEKLASEDVGGVITAPGDATGATSVPFAAAGASANAELQPSPLLPPGVVDKPLPGLPPVGRPGEEAADLIPSIRDVEEPCHDGRGLETTKLPRLDCMPLMAAPLS